MIEDDFYCTLKLKTGEELFARVAASEEDDRTMLLVSNPVIVDEIRTKHGIAGYKVEPWLKTTEEDLFVINMDDVLTMTENTNIDMIMYYEDYLRKNNKDNKSNLSREMGYISSVKDAKKTLEKLYRDS